MNYADKMERESRLMGRLGRFTQLEDAIKARQAAEDELFRPILEANGWEEKK